MSKLSAQTTKHFAKQCFSLMMKRGKYDATYATVCGTELTCSFDSDAWGVNVSYVTADMLPVTVFHKVQNSFIPLI